MQIKPNKQPYTPRKINKEKVDLILKDIAEGSTHRHASEANGISVRHFYNLIAQGIMDFEHDEDTLCSYLVHALRQIQQNEIKACKNSIKSNEKGHKGAEWVLEHYYWRDFGPQANLKELARQLEELKNEE